LGLSIPLFISQQSPDDGTWQVNTQALTGDADPATGQLPAATTLIASLPLASVRSSALGTRACRELTRHLHSNAEAV